MDTLERTKQHCETTKQKLLSNFAAASPRVRLGIVAGLVVAGLIVVVLAVQAFVSAFRPAQDENAKASLTVAVDPAS